MKQKFCDLKKVLGQGKTWQAETKTKGKPSPGKGPGATATINKLFSTGYFANKKNMGEIVKHINEELKLPYKITALSGLVNKLVKDKKLSRAINHASNKFEYFSKI